MVVESCSVGDCADSSFASAYFEPVESVKQKCDLKTKRSEPGIDKEKIFSTHLIHFSKNDQNVGFETFL